MRWFAPLCAVLAYGAVMLYDGDITHSDGFLLKYFLSSQSAIMWQCAFVFFALFAYITGAVLAQRKKPSPPTPCSAWVPYSPGCPPLQALPDF